MFLDHVIGVHGPVALVARLHFCNQYRVIRMVPQACTAHRRFTVRRRVYTRHTTTRTTQGFVAFQAHVPRELKTAPTAQRTTRAHAIASPIRSLAHCPRLYAVSQRHFCRPHPFGAGHVIAWLDLDERRGDAPQAVPRAIANLSRLLSTGVVGSACVHLADSVSAGASPT